MVTRGFTLVYILGAGHCGSTLLNLLLNGHSRILGLSEVETIGRYVASKGDVAEDPLQDPFWQEARRCYEAVSGKPFSQIDIFHPRWGVIRLWTAKDIARWARTNECLLSCVAKQAGVRFLVDASKFWQRLYLLQQSKIFDIKAIHLLRDGRGVVNSFVRKGVGFGPALRRWAAPALAAFYLRTKFKESDWLQVRYEQLAKQPETVLRCICAFLEVDFEPEMLAYRQHPDLGVGGNRMRRRQDQKIFLDERWKSEFSRSNRVKFMLLGTWLNKICGY